MDQIKTGKFIADMRNEQSLTQKELAERLNVSDKLISKWETGRGLPDVTVMGALCEVLRINVNELLSGEKLSLDEYSKKAEENIMNLVNETELTKKINKNQTLWGILGFALLLTAVFLAIVSCFGLNMWTWFIDAPTLIYTLGIFFAIIIITGEAGGFFKSFRLAFSPKETDDKELLISRRALTTALLAMAVSAVLNFTIGAMAVLIFSPDTYFSLGSYESSLYGFAIAFLSLLYGGIFETVILILWGRIRKKAG